MVARLLAIARNLAFILSVYLLKNGLEGVGKLKGNGVKITALSRKNYLEILSK